MADDEKPIYEIDSDVNLPDPDEVPVRDRKVVTQPYDLAIHSLIEQVNSRTIFLRPLSERPRFQRQYVWTDKLASKLVESILLKVPVPPCYLSQNDDFELDVIDGQQRIFSLYRFMENQFKLDGLEVISELNGSRFFELEPKFQRQLSTFTLRCILITNESHPEIKFEVFERLNSNTVPLNAQELRNCIYRGGFNDLLGTLSEGSLWLKILGRRSPDKRLRDEELILRFFAFEIMGLNSYRTPLKHWLNEAAKAGRSFNANKISQLGENWNSALAIVATWFPPNIAFRRPDSKAVNRALFDLVMSTAKKVDLEFAQRSSDIFFSLYRDILSDEEFLDLISRSVDHTKRTKRRFELWSERLEGPLIGG